MLGLSQFALIAIGALLLYLALRVVQMKRRSFPFLLAYPAFVLILVGGGVGVFVGAGNAAVALRLGHEVALAFTYGLTVLSLIAFWRIARRLIG